MSSLSQPAPGLTAAELMDEVPNLKGWATNGIMSYLTCEVVKTRLARAAQEEEAKLAAESIKAAAKAMPPKAKNNNNNHHHGGGKGKKKGKK